MNKYNVYYIDNDAGAKFRTCIDAESEKEAEQFFHETFDNCTIDNIELIL